LGDQTGENDTYAFGLEAHPGQSQGRPAMSTGSKPKEQIAACPICVLPRKPQPPGPATLDPPPDTIAERFRTRILIPVCQVRVAICEFQRVQGMTAGAPPPIVLIGLVDGGRGGVGGSAGGGDAGVWVV
jgi:hypothetical protein